MKKTLIALAALAATGAAMAQSSVTIYGVVDVGYTSVNNSGTGTDNTGLTSSNMTTNRLGFRGTEDLGGGLKAKFQVETSLAADAPAASSIGDRGAWVGLEGGFGEVRLGREYSMSFWSGFLFSPFGTGGVGNGYGFIMRSNTHGATGQTNQIWNNNAVTYSTPRIAGFQGHAQYAFDEVAAVGNDAGKSVGLRLNYTDGPLMAEIAYSSTDGGAAIPDTDPNTAGVQGTPVLGLNTTAKHKSVVGGVSYNFGVARVMANFGQEKASVQATGASIAKVTNFEIGAVAPVGPGRFRVSYNRTKLDVTALAVDPQVSKFAVGYIYDLSKRTALYATVASQKNKNGAAFALSGPATTAAANGRSTGYNIGISHTF